MQSEQEATDQLIGELTTRVESAEQRLDEAKSKLDDCQIELATTEGACDELRAELREFEEMEVPSRSRVELRSILERAYALDPVATEADLIKLGLRSWIIELRIDLEAGRTRWGRLVTTSALVAPPAVNPRAYPAVGGPR